jgi:hypothetical protein
VLRNSLVRCQLTLIRHNALDNTHIPALLQKERSAKEAAIRKAHKQARELEEDQEREPIQVFPRPKGQAGDSKRGFVLETAMGLDMKDEDEHQLYLNIVVRGQA